MWGVSVGVGIMGFLHVCEKCVIYYKSPLLFERIFSFETLHWLKKGAGGYSM